MNATLSHLLHLASPIVAGRENFAMYASRESNGMEMVASHSSVDILLPTPLIVKILSYLKDTYILDLLYRTVPSIRRYGDPLIGRIREYRKLKNAHKFMRFVTKYQCKEYIFMMHNCKTCILNSYHSAHLDERQTGAGNSLWFSTIWFDMHDNAIGIDGLMHPTCGMRFKFVKGYNRCIVNVYIHDRGSIISDNCQNSIVP